MRRPPQRGNPEKIDAAERQARVVELRRRRLTFAQIGQEIGVGASRAYAIYQKALAAIPAQQVDEHRAEELTLIDDAIRNLLNIAEDHTRPRTAIEAWNSIRGWAERKAKLLGLDAPSRMEVLTLDAIDAEIARLTAELGRVETGEAGAATGAARRGRRAAGGAAANLEQPG